MTEQKEFTLYWRNGEMETIVCQDLHEALKAKYSDKFYVSVLNSVAFYEEGKPSGDYFWCFKSKEWLNKKLVVELARNDVL